MSLSSKFCVCIIKIHVPGGAWGKGRWLSVSYRTAWSTDQVSRTAKVVTQENSGLKNRNQTSIKNKCYFCYKGRITARHILRLWPWNFHRYSFSNLIYFYFCLIKLDKPNWQLYISYFFLEFIRKHIWNLCFHCEYVSGKYFTLFKR